MTDEKKHDPTFELLDHEDEEQILADLRGVPVDKFIYKNKRGQVELSYAGTKWAVREFANRGEAIRVDGHPKVELCPIDPEHIVVTVLAKRVRVDKDTSREVVLDSTVGASRGWTRQAVTGGKTIPDEHFFAKTVSKATRNAQQALMPVEFKLEMIERLSGKPAPAGKPRQEAQQAPPSPAPAKEAPAAPPKAEKAAKAPQGADMASRQRLYMVLKKLAKTDEVAKQVVQDILGVASTKDASAEQLQELTKSVTNCLNGKSVLQKGANGKYLIMIKTDPAPAPEESVPAGAPDEELF